MSPRCRLRKKRNKPPTPVVTGIVLDKTLQRQIKSIARDEFRSFSFMVRTLLTEALQRREDLNLEIQLAEQTIEQSNTEPLY